jgi:cell division protein FtsQ
VSTVREARLEGATFVASLDHALGRLMRPLADLLPHRLRRAAEKIERGRRRAIGHFAAVGFLFVALVYALVVGGEIGRLADSLLVFAGFGIEDVKITGTAETSQIAVLDKLDISGSLVSFNVGKAQERLGELPWVDHAVVRKFYPSTLSVQITERKPFALWQRDGKVTVIDRSGAPIVPLDDPRFGKLPFVVGGGANHTAEDLLADLQAEPTIAAQMHAAVLVADRRWDLHLDNGVTVKLPETNVRAALAELVRLDREKGLLARDVAVVDLRLPDRITVRLPEGRSLDDVTSDLNPPANHPKTHT